MIRCLLVHVSRNQRGQPIRTENLFSSEIIHIGRGSGCKIHLPDPRVKLRRAAIRHAEDGKLHIEAKGAELIIDGFPRHHAELTPGMHIFVGPYQLIVEPASHEVDLVISVELIHPPVNELVTPDNKRLPITLAEAGLSKRRSALWLGAVIALLCLAIPMIPSFSPAVAKWQAGLPVGLNQSWNPGAISKGHHLFAKRCDTCHQSPFQPVPDKACLGCHKDLKRHIADKALNSNSFNATRCAQCHPDHRGDQGLVRQDEPQCVTCHGNLKHKNPQTKLGDVRSFSTDHPPFKLTLISDTNKGGVRIAQTSKTQLVEHSGLEFSHKVHLDKEGISSPEGDTVMKCSDCHHPEEANIHFKPINMKKDCQQSGCHTIDFKARTSGRQVPHGSEKDVISTLREYYAKLTISEQASGHIDEEFKCRAMTGVVKPKHERVMECANEKARMNAELLFARPGKGCGVCHEIKPVAGDRDVPWKITPVTITHHWMANALFPHGKHATTECAECHDKTRSSKSTDVFIPAIEKCRECHAGGTETNNNKIGSSCKTCHRFHTASQHN